ncbi:COX15/CtaA family protein [Hydrogenophaga sp. 5NK40-0174]|uniref:COX15/CtaA family protein n=1 Tax=Hydrogenophaga sp. 5NK40-0174 TaxID=3127649 RepID=UPI00310744D7
MESQSLYDLSPILWMMGFGLLLAAAPLSWLWLRHRNASGDQRYQRLAVLTLFLTFDLVLFGAFTRLTDSGLGCPDWPGCYGSASPVGAHAEISQAQEAMPTGPVTHSKAWVEMIHRYLATGVGVLIIALTVMAWRQRRQLPLSPWWATFTLVWVCLQGAFGALTVTMKLFPAIVTLHLLGGLILIALLRVQTVQPLPAPQLMGAGRWWWALAVVTGMVWLQIALGGWVSTNYAVLACNEFPACQGSFWPAMNFDDGFTLWRPLGMDGSGQPITFAALTAIHYVHRLMAYAVLVALVWLGWRLRREPIARGLSNALLALAAWQLLTGLSNVILDWPLLAAVAHTGGAAALVMVLTGSLVRYRGAMGSPSVTPVQRATGALT